MLDGAQLDSFPRHYRGHSVTIFRGRIYDAAEVASMPLTLEYLTRCVREDAEDEDVFNGFASILLLRPTKLLMNALRNKTGVKRPADPASAASEAFAKRHGKARMA